jgi:hypothetical protein
MSPILGPRRHCCHCHQNVEEGPVLVRVATVAAVFRTRRSDCSAGRAASEPTHQRAVGHLHVLRRCLPSIDPVVPHCVSVTLVA